jgi:tetratricopeptide (TPR) repeat protein
MAGRARAFPIPNAKFLIALISALFAVPAAAQPVTNPPASIEQLQASLQQDPANPQLHIALGLAYWDRDDDARALESFQRAVKAAPRSAEAHNWLGVALLKKADLPGAVRELKRAIELDANYGRAYTNLGTALLRSGDVAEAVHIFEKALSLEPNNLAAHMNLGLALRDKGDLSAALTHLKLAADGSPDNAGVQYELGQTLRQNGDLPAAIAAFARALGINPELREGYYALGTALRQQSASARKPAAPAGSAASSLFQQAQDAAGRGDLMAAREQLSQAIKLDDGHAEAHNLLGFVLGQQGDLPSAIPHFQRAIALAPDSSDAHYNLGAALWYGGAKERALSELHESVRLDPSSGAAAAFLGMTLRETGDTAAARVNLQRAIALLPSMASAYIDLGITYALAGDLDKALGQFEAGLNVAAPTGPAPDWDAALAGLRSALRPGAAASTPAVTLASAHHTLGRLLGQKGAGTTEVAAEFREAIRLQSDFAEAHNHLGLVLLQDGDDAGGITALREAVRISPDYADAHANLGAALTPTDPDEAIRELQKAVSLAPNSVKAQFNLAVAYGSSPRGGADREIEQLRKVLELAPSFARAHVSLGKALLSAGKAADAIDELRRAVSLESENGEAHYQLGLALARAGRNDDATAELQKGRELVAAADRRQNANLDIAEGRAALDSGDLDKAAARFRHAIDLSPASAEAHRDLGTALERQGKAADASAAFRQALELNPGDAAARSHLAALTTASVGGDDPARVRQFEEYVRQAKYKELEPLAAEYVKARASSAWGWYVLGYTLFAQQKIGESIQALAKSLELDVRNAEAHKILGRDLMIIGRFDAAQVEFEQGIRYRPESADMHYNLGKLFSIQDNWEPARKEFDAALRIDPSYLEALDALGFALEALGDDAGALVAYEKAITLNEARRGQFVSAHTNLSAYYNRTGNPEKALDYASKAIELDPKSDRAWFQTARAQERQGRLDAAVKAASEAIALNPRASSYYYVLAGLYRQLGRMDDSRKALESFTRLERESQELEKMRREAAANQALPGRKQRD